MARFLLPLNDTTVVFLPPDDTGLPTPYAAQITVKTERRPNVGILSTHFLVQHEITDLILKIVSAHIHESFPPYAVFDGAQYTLFALGIWPKQSSV
ncbi:unnamed protein product [Somion occarium]|uniref:Uncharacterized protein n=1 Tax=Somion occarium TaxID=3059160 RepID=A0ABP1CVQ7_9APHY